MKEQGLKSGPLMPHFLQKTPVVLVIKLCAGSTAVPLPDEEPPTPLSGVSLGLHGGGGRLLVPLAKEANCS